MHKVFTLVNKDVREALQTKSTYIYILFFLFLVFPYFDVINSNISQLKQHGAPQVMMIDAARSVLNNMYYSLPLVITMMISGIFSAYAVLLEKTTRTIESLMATPLSLKQIWVGKSLAVALPSIAFSFIFSTLVLFAINLILVRPALHTMIFPDWLPLLSCYLIIPLVTCLVVMIVSFLQLITTNPRFTSFIYTAIFLGVYFAIILGQVSFNFGIIYAALVLLLVIVTLIVSRFLKGEKVVLSSKN